jgi:hypothetical protein
VGDLRHVFVPCYVCYSDNNLTAFLFIKIENEDENYSEINPAFAKKKRLKIGTLKVSGNGYKIGERFLKTIFDNANQYKVDEIYVTIFNKRPRFSVGIYGMFLSVPLMVMVKTVLSQIDGAEVFARLLGEQKKAK